MKILTTAAAAGVSVWMLGATQAVAETFTLDPTHSIISFSWTHGGFSTTKGIFFGVTGEIDFNQEDPAASSVTASVPLGDMATVPELKDHLGGERWFNGLDGKMVTFTSTGIEVTGRKYRPDHRRSVGEWSDRRGCAGCRDEQDR